MSDETHHDPAGSDTESTHVETARAAADSDAAAEPAGSISSTSIAEFLDLLSRPEPDPGGGAVSALLAGLAAGLVGMVAGYERESAERETGEHAAAEQKTDGETRSERMIAHLRIAEGLRLDTPRLSDLDAVASAGFAPAYALPQGAARDEAIRTASVAGAESAAELGARAAALVPVIEQLVEETGMFLSADVGVAAAVLSGSLRGAAITLAEDLRLAGSSGRKREDLHETLGSLDRAAGALDDVVRRVRTSLQPEDPSG